MTKDETLKTLRSLGILIAKHTQGDYQRKLLESIQIAIECVKESKNFKEK